METEIIKSTKDYDQFKFLLGNRNINKYHTMRLTLSISKKNMLATNPILVNEEMYVIDGQHRLEVAKNNNLDIYYIVVPHFGINEVMQLNASSMVWSFIDYLQSYALRGNKDYQWLLEFMEEYHIPATVAFILLYGGDVKYAMEKAKRGEVNISQDMQELAERRASLADSVRPYVKKKGMMPRSFYSAISYIDERGLGKLLVSQLKKRGTQFYPEPYVNEAKAQLEKFVKQ